MERLSFDIRIPETVQNEGLALHQAPETMVLKLRKKSIRATLNRSKSTRSTASRFSLTRSRRNILAEEDGSGTCDPWRLCWTISTACIPSALMTKAGIKKESHQAWREKVTLCMICCLFMALLGFLAFGFNNSACNTKASLFPILAFNTESIFKSRKNQNLVSIRGYVYDIRSVFDRHAQYPFFTQNPSLNLNQNSTGLDASSLFPPALSAKCLSLLGGRLQIKCVNGESFPGIGYCHKWDSVESQLLALLKGVVIYDWDIIDVPFSKLTVYNNQVINIATYLGTESRVFSPEIDLIIRSHAGKDLSKALQVVKNGPQVGQCLAQLYMVGKIESDDGICLLSQAMLYVSLVIIVSVVLLRFLVALYFRWIKNPDFKIEKLKQEKHHSMRASNNSFPFGIDSSIVISKRSNTVRSTSPFGVQPYCIMFVTCYSESDASIRSTLDSLALTVYSEERKLLFIVQDGLVKGSDNPISTPEILLNMLELDEKWPLPIAFPYMAVADGKRQINYAKVYVAWYNVSGRSIPTILVVKTGSPEEVTEAKPGNRGKRDSQILFMRFLEHITFNDRLSPFEYDLFQKMHYIMGATPEVFEYILFVDADTKVEPDSLPRMAACMSEDPMVMGLCGETRIGNKTDSYVI
jgi:chitin synthase